MPIAIKIPKMKGGRWTKELELELAKLYKKFRCLWMTGLPAYNDLDRRYAAYVRIVEALRPGFRSLTVPKVVYKIRDLRYRYCVELTKIERATGYGENYTPNVSWFQVMHSFLDVRFRTDEDKESNTNFSKNENINYDYSGTRLTSSTCQTIYENHLKTEESKSTVGEFEESGNDAENCADDVCDRIRRCRETEESEEVKKIEKNHLGDFYVVKNPPLNYKPCKMKMEKKMTKTLIYSTRKRNSEFDKENINKFDEFNAFAMSIGSQLKTLDPKLIPKLEIMILIILNEERMKIL